MRRQRTTLTALIAAAVMVTATVAAAAAEDAFALFDRFLAETQTAVFAFKQSSFDQSGELLEETGGTLWYRAPRQFRMAYDSPAAPLVVSDGEQVWIYEQDIRQAVVRPFAAVKETGLLSILTGGGLDALRARYTLSAGVGGDMTRLHADSLTADDSIRRISLGFAGGDGGLRQVTITDAFDGVIQMDIKSVSRRAVADSQFTFSPPPQTDILVLDE